MAPSADLGGSSNYSNNFLEGCRGEGFHVNRIWTWVSRSLACMITTSIAFAVTGRGVNIRQLVRWYCMVTLYMFVLQSEALSSAVFSF